MNKNKYLTAFQPTNQASQKDYLHCPKRKLILLKISKATRKVQMSWLKKTKGDGKRGKQKLMTCECNKDPPNKTVSIVTLQGFKLQSTTAIAGVCDWHHDHNFGDAAATAI